MNKKLIILALLATVFLLIAALSCSDDKSTGSSTRELSDAEAFQEISSNFDIVGMQAIGAAIAQATTNWDGYTQPDIDEYLGGFGKVAATQDTVFQYEYRNGWHIFYVSLTMLENYVEGYEGDKLGYAVVASDSTQFKVDGIALPFPADPDYMDERAHIDFDAAMHNDTSSLSIDLLVYLKTVLELITDDDLRLNLVEKFTFGMDATIDGQGSMSGTFMYDVTSTDLMFSSADDFTCPTSGTIHMEISLRVSDGTQTATASGTIDIVITDGDAAVTVTVGTYSDTEYYTDICENEWASPSFGSIIESLAK
ncbi:MAG: hypothetical protein KAT85_03865 [candidate division Zixibacteria bacterium]|jgi:hypothetical protein|nr:hypothetical protein [candidate division Zixibacteria bacterium]